MKIEYKSKDNSYHVELEYFNKCVMKKYPGIGKSYPVLTQCILKINGVLRGFGEVTKHHQDEHNLKYACVYATKKIINKVVFKDTRKILWNELFKKLDEINENKTKINSSTS